MFVTIKTDMLADVEYRINFVVVHKQYRQF
jgi:hypothetical protein